MKQRSELAPYIDQLFPNKVQIPRDTAIWRIKAVAKRVNEIDARQKLHLAADRTHKIIGGG